MSKTKIIIAGAIVLIGGGVALYLMRKKDPATVAAELAAATPDPEVGDFKPVAGVLNLAPGLHAAYATRVQGFVNTHNGDFYPALYADVMKVGMPQYTALINSMSQPEQQTLYHLVNDMPASSMSASDPAYAALIALRDKYKILFY